MKFIFITNKVDIAQYANQCKVGRIFVDLEILGKFERQGHLDTVISRHSMEDVGNIRQVLPDADIMVRINPLNENTQKEVDDAIVQGANSIMLPMFQSKHEIDTVGKMIDGRVGFIPLIETKSAAENLVSYVNSDYVSEFYIGLNDLHRELGLKFMFELLSSGYVDNLTQLIKNAGKPFGFGGIARIGEGDLPAKLILAEHVRLGSSSVILSRAFHQRSETLEELNSKVDLALEIEKLLNAIDELKVRNDQQVERDSASLKKAVEDIVGAEQ